jgi:carbon monoxide dehydrogenase subunit G
MTTVSSSTTINQPVDKVFKLVTDAATQLQPGVQAIKVTPPGPLALGSMLQYTSEVMGKKYETGVQITAYVPNQKYSTKTTGVRPMETVYVFEPAGNGTKLTISMEMVGGYPAAAEATMRQSYQKNLDDSTSKIKQMAEK